MSRLRLDFIKPAGLDGPRMHVARVNVNGKWVEARGQDRVKAVNALIDRLAELLEEATR